MALAPFGPRRSQDSAERISRVLHEAGLSGTALTFPTSSRQPVQKHAVDTMAGLGYTSPGSKRRRLMKWSIALGIIAVVAAVSVGALLKKRITFETASGLPSISPVTSAVQRLDNAASVAAPVTSITPSGEPSTTGKPQLDHAIALTSAVASVQPKVAASIIPPAPVSRAPNSKDAASDMKRNSAGAPNVARSSQPARPIEAQPAASAPHGAVTKTTPSNSIGGRL